MAKAALPEALGRGGPAVCLGERGSPDHSSPTTNDPLLPAGWEGRPAQQPVTAGRQAQAEGGPRRTPAPSPQVFTVSRGCLEFKPSAYLHREGGAGRARAGSLKSKTPGGGPGQARPQGLRQSILAPGVHPPGLGSPGPRMPSLKCRAPSLPPGVGGGGRSFTPRPFIRSRRPDARPRRTPRAPSRPPPGADPPLGVPKQPTQAARLGNRGT